MAKKNKSGIEILESAEALQKEIGKAEGFFTKNKSLLGIVAGVIAAIAVAFYGYKYYTDNQNKEAMAAMYDSVYYYESDSLDLALKGAGGNLGLIEVADTYGSTKSGNLAKMYVGNIYMKQGKFDDAIKYLKDFSSSDLVVQGEVYCLLGDAYLEKGSNDDAITEYKKASAYNPNKFTTPRYLAKLATAYETAGNKAEALSTYNDMITNYPNSSEGIVAKKYKSRLEAETGE